MEDLMVGAVMVKRPDLFKAVIAQVPIFDMIRFPKLLAGASWIDEYGDPKKRGMRKYLLSYSPYHNVKKSVKYPHLLLTTSQKDDRVHPGHARKMMAKMKNQGHKNLYYFEHLGGGHSLSTDLKQRAKNKALLYEFLYQTIF